MANEKNLCDWTLGEVAANCRKRTPTDSTDVKSGCVGCPLNGVVCDVTDDGIITDSPDGWTFPQTGDDHHRQRKAKGADTVSDRFQLARVLGVEEGETWRYPGLAGLYRVYLGAREYWDENNGWLACDCEEDLIRIIARPEDIIHNPRLTEAELERCRVYGAKYVTSLDGSVVGLWREKPNFKSDIKDGWTFVFSYQGEELIAGVSASLFPSVKPGDCIDVEEARG